MVRGILGKKVGMTQIFDDSGRIVPVTVVEAGPCVIVQRRSQDSDGYEAVQLGLVERSPRRNAPKAISGHFATAGIPPTRFVAEVPVDSEDESKPGDSVLADIKSKGRGFQGVIKRHNFGGGKASHGSMHHRAPGSVGRSASPSRVFPGQKMPGQLGNKRVTVKNAQVVKVDTERNLLFLKGGVPGARNSYIRIVKVRGWVVP
jgi:large subunit ribosomal protein L3